jgi:serine/threonine protein kinase
VARLQQLLAGALSAPASAQLARHVEGCADCQQTLQDLPPAGASWAEKLTRVQHKDNPNVTQDEIKAESADLGFLDPSEQPGHLGRLGKYEIAAEIGRGGMGVVFKALDEKLHRVVAIKAMLPQLAASGTARKRFIREAQAAAAVSNEHVIDIHAVDQTGKVPYLVMEFVAGISLQEKLDRVGQLEVKEILRIGLQMAEGLAAAHKQGLVHRDIKPANILLENGIERVKITDFGLARAVDDASLTQSGVVAGTPMFMAPEQALGERLDHRADLFSLGSVLYLMCTGRPPFRANSTLAVLKRVTDDTPRPIREINPEIPDWLANIIGKLHAKKPQERYQAASEVAEILNEKLAALQLHGQASSFAEVGVAPGAAAPPRRPARRVAAVLGGLLLFALACGGAYFLWRPGPPPVKSDDDQGNPDKKTLTESTPPLAVAPFIADKAREHQDAWAQYLGVDVEITNSIGMKLRLIPPGEFMMGDDPGNIPDAIAAGLKASWGQGAAEGLARSSLPMHSVRLTRAYYLGTCEVTVNQFRLFAQNAPYRTTRELVNPKDPNWQRPDWKLAEDQPAGFISYPDALAFCRWLGEREGRVYQLPTEAQWEYACRAGTVERWFSGEDSAQLERYAVMGQPWPKGPSPVGQKAANPFGLFDMHGNMSEWCLDWHRGPYAPGAAVDPVFDGDFNPRFPYRVTRGGAWGEPPMLGRSAGRGHFGPATPFGPHGFRVAIVGDLTAKKTPPSSVSQTLPFVILAKDKRAEQQHPTFATAVAAAQSGDIIEIRGNGPFVMPGIALGGKALRIQAGAGFRPRLTQSLDDPLLEKRPFIFTNAALALEGLTFERPMNVNTDKNYPALVSSWKAPLHVSHCRFVGRSRYPAVVANESDGSSVLNCEFQGPLTGAVGWNRPLRGEFVMENCLAVATWSCLEVSQRDANLHNVQVRSRRNTFLGRCTLSYYIHGPPNEFIKKRPDRQVPELHLDMAENVIDGDWARWYIAEDKKYLPLAEYPVLLPSLLTLADERNLYSPGIKAPWFLRVDSFERKVTIPVANLGGWNRLWKNAQPTSLEGEARFVGGDLRKKGQEGLLVPADFRLAVGSPGKGVLPGGKDLGADVDKVGPGAPYERWRQAPEYQQWRTSIDKVMSSP